MEIITGFGVLASVVAPYWLVATIWSYNSDKYVINRPEMRNQCDADKFFNGLLWPVTMPASLVLRGHRASRVLKEKLKDKAKERQQREKMSNLTRPVDILAAMMMQRVLREPELLKIGEKSRYRTWESTCGKERIVLDYYNNLDYFTVNGETFSCQDISDFVVQEFHRVVKKSIVINSELKKAKATADQDNRALDAIESMFVDKTGR